MYRRVNSDRFMVLTTLGIVIVMGIFTWVMYGMAKQVFTMTDVMVELNGSFQTMTADIHTMSVDMEGLTDDISEMNENLVVMTGHISEMDGSISGMTDDVALMAESMPSMTSAVMRMSASVDRMTQDISRATYAFTQPMSFMWGNAFPF